MKTWGRLSYDTADTDADTDADDTDPDAPYAPDPDGRCDVVGCYDEAVIRTVSSDPSIVGPFDYCHDCAERQMERFADLMLYLAPSETD